MFICRQRSIPVVLSLLALAGARTAQAGEITKDGAVELLDDISQMAELDGTADFNAGPADDPVPLDAYADQGMTFHTGALVNVLPGVATSGAASQPVFHDWLQPDDYFPAPSPAAARSTGFRTSSPGSSRSRSRSPNSDSPRASTMSSTSRCGTRTAP